MPRPDRLPRLSRWLYWGVSLPIPVVPALVLVGAALTWRDPSRLAAALPMLPEGTVIGRGAAMAALLIGALALWPTLVALLAMRRLFAGWAAGEVLTETAGRLIRRTGLALGLLAACTVLLPCLQALLLSMAGGAGGVVAITASHQTYALLLASGFLVAIGWALAEAAAVAEENRGFV